MPCCGMWRERGLSLVLIGSDREQLAWPEPGSSAVMLPVLWPSPLPNPVQRAWIASVFSAKYA
jgi:hypothetical protein